MKLYVRDLALRSRFEGLDIPDDVIVIDLADDGAVASFERERPAGRVIGFYPHVRKDLVERAKGLGAEPIEKRVLFADLSGVLRC